MTTAQAPPRTPLLTGPLIATLTPFARSGGIDRGALADYLAFLAEAGVESLIVNGTTGEFPSLTHEERLEVVRLTRERFRGRIVNNVSACSVAQTLDLIERSADFADAALLLPPFYYAAAEPEGLDAFFAQVLARCAIPVFLYNFPRHTQNPISPSLLGALAARFDGLAGIKDSGGDLEMALAYKQTGLPVFVGKDTAALEVLLRGLDGSVSGGGNPVPELLVGIRRAFQRGALEEAGRFQQKLDAWSAFRSALPSSEIALVKAGIASRVPGFPIRVRPPLVEAGSDLQGRIAEALRSYPVTLVTSAATV